MPISLKNTASILPYVRYSPQSNAMTVAGDDNKPRDIPFLNKSFAIDIENGAMGWLLIGEGIRDWKPFPIGDAPPSPGPNYKRGFAILLYAPKLLDSPEAHDMCASTGAHLSFCERLYNECEQNFGKGDVPIVRITDAEAIKVGKGKSRDLKFEIVKWVPRPAAMIEALAKLKSASAAADRPSTNGEGAGDDFDDAPPAPPQEEPAPDKAATEKPKKGRGKTQAAERPVSDILDDELPFA
jgi:hypothetical protein